MIPRRSLVTGAVLGGTLSALAAEDAAAAPAPAPAGADVTDEMVNRIVQAIASLRTDVQNLKSFNDITPVRDAQLTYLRANGKFPDFIEAGSAIWFGVHDWHIRWQQPMTLGRDDLGRYTIVLNQTTVILRSDAIPAFISLPYDNR